MPEKRSSRSSRHHRRSRSDSRSPSRQRSASLDKRHRSRHRKSSRRPRSRSRSAGEKRSSSRKERHRSKTHSRHRARSRSRSLSASGSKHHRRKHRHRSSHHRSKRRHRSESDTKSKSRSISKSRSNERERKRLLPDDADTNGIVEAKKSKVEETSDPKNEVITSQPGENPIVAEENNSSDNNADVPAVAQCGEGDESTLDGKKEETSSFKSSGNESSTLVGSKLLDTSQSMGKDETPNGVCQETAKEANISEQLSENGNGTATKKKESGVKDPQISSSSNEESASKPVNVNALKMDLSKALAQARSALAGIRKPAVEPTSAKPSEEIFSIRKDDDEDKSKEKDESSSPSKEELPMQSQEKSPEQQESVVVVDDDNFDMFSADPDCPVVPASTIAPATKQNEDPALQSNWDDADGYYRSTTGEILNQKYQVLGNLGQGVFSTVLQCKVVEGNDKGNTVAVKLVRNNDTMKNAAQTEFRILSELVRRDPDNKKHIVRLLDRFEYRNHVALVFEPLQMNLREAMKKFGGKTGISLRAVRLFAKQLFISLHHLQTCGIVHADIKPDNILLDEKQNIVKLCDFGSAFEVNSSDNEPTPYLVSRFYRAPEIILGMHYGPAVDMWSIGCCLFEMFTGKVMFPGATNNEMLKKFMEFKGKVPNKLIKKHKVTYVEKFETEPHFTDDCRFISREIDKITNKPINRYMDFPKPVKDLGSMLLASKYKPEDKKLLMDLKDLLDKIFVIDPSKRISVRDALHHSFTRGGKAG